MPVCFNCNNNFTDGVEICPFCGAKFSSVKYNFLKYIGPEDSLSGYQKSYKLVLLKYIIEYFDNNNESSVARVIEKIRLFYYSRYERGLVTDFDVDDRIKNIQNSNDYDVFAVMKSQPYKVINDKGFLYLNRNASGDLVFVFNEDLSKSMSKNEWDKVLTIINKKLDLYFATKVGVVQSEFVEAETSDVVQTIDFNTSIYEIDEFSTNLKNLLKKRGLTTINDIIEFDKENGYDTIHILGGSSFVSISKLIINCMMQNNGDISKCFIRHIFCENSYASFIRYCIKNKLETVDDLFGFNFDVLLLEKGFGAGKVVKIKERFEEITSGNIQCVERINTSSKSQDVIKVHSSNENLTICDLRFLGLSNKAIKDLSDSNISNAKMLDGFSRIDLLKILGSYKIDEMFSCLKSLSKPLIEISSEILMGFKEDRDFQIYIKRFEGFSLQEIADEYACTRERVRQLESKFGRKITPIISNIVENYFEENNTTSISTNDVLEFFDDDDLDKIVMYNLKNSDHYEYLSFAELFLKKESPSQNTFAKLYELAKDFVGEGIDLYSELDNLDDMLSNAGFGFLDAEAFLNFLEDSNAHFYGDYVTYSKKSYSFLCSKIVEEFFPNGIRMSTEQDIDRLRELVKQKFGDVELPENDHALTSALSRVLVISDRGVATSINNIQFEYDTMQTIKDFIDENPLNTLYYREIFNEFEGLLAITTSINNYYCLHGVLQYCFPNDFTYSRDTVSKKDGIGIKLTLEDRVNELLVQNAGAMNKKTIANNVGGCSDIMLFNLAVTSKKITLWDFYFYNSMDNIDYTDEEREQLKDTLELLLSSNNGYCSDGLLFENIKMSMSDFLIRNNIENRTNLFYVTNKLFEGEYQFSRPHICSLDFSKSVNAQEIMLHLMGEKDIILHSEFAAISKKMVWSEITSSFVFAEIEKDTIRISDDEYLKKTKFIINNEEIYKIKQALDLLCNSFGFVSAILFDDFSQLPKMRYEWNTFLLTSLVENFNVGYKVINPKNKDRRYQKGIIVKQDCKCESLDDLVFECLKQAGISEITEMDLLSFLLINGIVRKVLPKEIYNSTKLNYNEGIFNI